jgi:hypothetical protein
MNSNQWLRCYPYATIQNYATTAWPTTISFCVWARASRDKQNGARSTGGVSPVNREAMQSPINGPNLNARPVRKGELVNNNELVMGELAVN